MYRREVIKMSNGTINKRELEPDKIKVSSSVREIELDELTIPRMIKLSGIIKNGNKCEWHLKITPKGKLALL